MLHEFSFSFKFLFPLEDNRTTAANYLTKENRQSILVVVVLDAIMQMSYSTKFLHDIAGLEDHDFRKKKS